MKMIAQTLNNRTWYWIIAFLSVAVVGAVAILLGMSQESNQASSQVYILPRLNAVLNSFTFLLLITGFYFIRQKNVAAHKMAMVGAFVFSSAFLVSYIIYHYQAPHTSYGGEGFMRSLYFFLLITHIILAAVIVPLVLITLFRALKLDYARHKKIARWTLPIWLYVSASGILVYLLISPYYPV